MVEIVDAGDPADIAHVRALLLEYAASLDVDLHFQQFDREVAELPGHYTPPGGTLLLAYVDHAVAGCIAVHAWQPPDVAEIKRLFVRPGFRGLQLGEQLMRAALAFARSAGYGEVWLDTLPSMTAARALYASMGFRPRPPYRENPVPGVTYLALTLLDTPE